MRIALCAAAVATWIVCPAKADTALERGFDGAVRGCEEWVLNPKSWSDGSEPFIAAVGLGNAMGLVSQVDETSLPPPSMRVANHYWRINSTTDAGFVLVVSDRLPICHITGGGHADLQPAIQAVLSGQPFADRWEKISEATKGETTTTTFRNRRAPEFSILVSRAASPNQRLDHVQVLATATLEILH